MEQPKEAPRGHAGADLLAQGRLCSRAGGIGGEIAKDVGSAMGKALLTSLFGESKSEREARLARERETVTAQTAAADEERLKAEEAAREAAELPERQ